MTEGRRPKCWRWYNEAHRDSRVAALTRRERNSFNFWKGSEARREEEQERAEKRLTLGLLGEEAFLEFQSCWSSSSGPDLASLAHCEDQLDQALDCDSQPSYYGWRAVLRGRQQGRLGEALQDAIKWRRRTTIQEEKGRAQMLVLTIQLARSDIYQAKVALEKAVRKGWFSQEEEVEARAKIRLTRQQLASRSTRSDLASSQEVRRRRSQERTRRKEIKEWSMLSMLTD